MSSFKELHGESDEAVDGAQLQKQSQMLDYTKSQYIISKVTELAEFALKAAVVI
ncbi:hypothetical protein I306_04038 [Cryptococcus gattii EJB2]|uniref:Uncharacterized protein n=1 Tax=Cryptococcus gattii EJB2 TaxID=1296103 RepID=A0ABR5BTV7_9TREE|nr:hypothetical protein I306_04038 [Cryptococcus gattii EJB2]